MVGAYWEPSSELEWELVSGILGGGIGNLMNVELAKWVAVESIQKKNESIQLVIAESTQCEKPNRYN